MSERNNINDDTNNHQKNIINVTEGMSCDGFALDYEELFTNEKVAPEKLLFAKTYLMNKMGVSLNEDSYMEFSTIKSINFGFLVVHIVWEYEKFLLKLES